MALEGIQCFCRRSAGVSSASGVEIGTIGGVWVGAINTSCAKALLRDLVTVSSWAVKATFVTALSCTVVRYADVSTEMFDSAEMVS